MLPTVVVALVVGLVIGLLVAFAGRTFHARRIRRSEQPSPGGRDSRAATESSPPRAVPTDSAVTRSAVGTPVPGSTGEPAPLSLAPELERVLTALPGTVIVADRDGRVAMASPSAGRMRLIRRGRIAFDDITECATEAIESRIVAHSDVTVRRPPLRKGLLDLRVRAIPLPGEHAVLLIDDLTEANRVAEVRRDFIANVSHELKTPVGAISLLAEALDAAKDDPDSVRHFANRLQTEASRLTHLINDVIDLSRLQGDDPMSHAEPVCVDELITNAVSYVRGAADAKSIEIIIGGSRDVFVFGDESQLLTALRNLLSNAIAYSDPGTRVAVAVRTSDSVAEIDVKDQGIGIPDAELGRIFERFYRVDNARSRVTGGTGVGLSIVRNVCRNHGGDVQVWSVENEGSTFTMQLPRHVPQDTDEALATASHTRTITLPRDAPASERNARGTDETPEAPVARTGSARLKERA